MTKKPNGRAAKRQYWQQMVIDWELGDFKTQDEFCQHAGISRKLLRDNYGARSTTINLSGLNWLYIGLRSNGGFSCRAVGLTNRRGHCI